MSLEQQQSLSLLLTTLVSRGYKRGHHGVCVGADAQFHGYAKEREIYIIGHPGIRRDGKCFTRADVVCDETLPVKLFLDRDRDIVLASDVMIATPQQFEEVFFGSGTWATYRFAKLHKKPLYLIMPDGRIEYENGATE
jgi:hypothetical protein